MSRPTHEEFAGHPIAHLRYSRGVDATEALGILATYAGNGVWKQHPTEWFGSLHHLADRGGDEQRAAHELGRRIIEQLLSLRLDDPLTHDLLPKFLTYAIGVDELQAKAIVDRFVEGAGPGEASLGADLLQAAVHASRCWPELGAEFLSHFRAIAKWMLRFGAAELRSRRRTELLFDIAQLFVVEAADAAGFLRIVSVGAGMVETLGQSIFTTETLRQVTEALIRADALKSESVTLTDLLSVTPEWTAAQIIRQLMEHDADRVSRRLLLALGTDELKPRTAKKVWTLLLDRPPEADWKLIFESKQSTEIAAEALREHSKRRDSGDEAACAHSDRAWAELVTRAYVRAREIVAARPRSEDALPIESCVGFRPGITQGIRDGLLREIESQPESDRFATMRLARDILRSDAQDSSQVRAALSVLVTVSDGPSTPSKALDTRRIELVLAELLQRIPLLDRRGHSMARAFDEVSSVRLEKLDQGDKVRIRGNELLVDWDEVATGVGSEAESERAEALAAVYVVHEVIHWVQGVGSKDTISKLRSAGGEMTVMHLDLGADHSAALIVSKCFPKWSLTWIKDLQGRSLSSWPIERTHTSGARIRKAQRLVGLRLDFLIRELGRELLRHDEAYVFADYGPAAGPFLALSSGPPFAAIGKAAITDDEARVLWETATSRHGLGVLDSTLGTLIKRFSQ